MKLISIVILTLAAAVLLAACGSPAANTGNHNANTGNAVNANAAKPVAAAPTIQELMALEKAGWEAWKNRDSKWTEENYSDKAMNIGSTGRTDKAAAIKALAQQKCEIKSYSLSDEKMQMIGPDVAVLTFRGAQDYICDGKKGPADVWAASAYIRESGKWKAVFYAETPVIDPKSLPKPPAAKKEEAKKEEAKPDAATEAVLSIEKKVWEAWKNKDAKALEDILAKDFMFYGGGGRLDRATAIRMWATENKCDIKSVWLNDAKAVELTADVSLLTYIGGGEGTCDGQPIVTEWYGGFYKKDGDVWRPEFGMGVAQ